MTHTADKCKDRRRLVINPPDSRVGSRTKQMVLRVLGYFPFERIEHAVASIRVARLKQRLASCGERTVISDGLFVERPELACLGEDVSIGPNISIMGAGGVDIRDGAMLATGTLILTTQHDPTADAMRTTGVHGRIEIGEFSWIGAGAILLPGISIGKHAVVGAGAVVTKDIPPYALAVGIPARVLRDRREPIDTRIGEPACHG